MQKGMVIKMSNITIAIDGPGAAGKSTVAKTLSKELGFLYLDTGALYRAVGYHCLQNGIDVKDEPSVTSTLGSIPLDVKHSADGMRVYLGDTDVSEEIRRPEMSMAASDVSVHPSVRAFLLSFQRDIAEEHNVIMDGRDIGTVILPNATLKIFLTATTEERTRRRHSEFQAKGIDSDFDALLSETKHRDEQDSTRAEAPLRCADDAVNLDTTEMTFDEVIQTIKNLLKQKIADR